jgi:hypothetical protein
LSKGKHLFHKFIGCKTWCLNAAILNFAGKLWNSTVYVLDAFGLYVLEIIWL